MLVYSEMIVPILMYGAESCNCVLKENEKAVVFTLALFCVSYTKEHQANQKANVLQLMPIITCYFSVVEHLPDEARDGHSLPIIYSFCRYNII